MDSAAVRSAIVNFSSQNAVKSLKNGSQVLVRVIADRGNGRFEGSVAGVRVNLTSSRALKPGETCGATINAKDGTIFVTPKEQPGLEMPKELVQMTVAQNRQLESFLQAIGLPADCISERLLQVMKQLEMKLNPALLLRLHNLSVKFKEKSVAASEILMLLAKKGLNASEEEILTLLAELDGDFSDTEKNQNSGGKANQKKSDKFALMNKANKVEGGWFFIPFELLTQNMQKTLGQGVIKMLMAENKSLKKLNLNCSYSNRKYMFSLNFEGRKCTKLTFNIDGYDSKVEEFESSLQNYFKGAADIPEILWTSKETLEGFACSDEELVFLGGSV